MIAQATELTKTSSDGGLTNTNTGFKSVFFKLRTPYEKRSQSYNSIITTHLHINVKYTNLALGHYIFDGLFATVGAHEHDIVMVTTATAHLVPYMLPEKMACSMNCPSSILDCITSRVTK